jgi:hypothetical protein
LTLNLVSSKQESEPGLATTIEFDVGYIDDYGVEITWYDASGNELGQMTADDIGIDHIVLSDPHGITTVTIDTSNDTAGAAIDNLLFH